MSDDEIVKKMLEEASYLDKLYELFILIDKYADGHFEEKKDELRQLEDNIYTINGKVLTDQERLLREIKKIKIVNENNKDLASKKIITEKIQNLLELMNEVFDSEINENYILDIYKEKYDNVRNDAIFNTKKRISIIESELDIPINFLEASYYAFLDIYKKYRKMYKKEYYLNE